MAGSWQKTSPELVALLDQTLRGSPCDRKSMFGGIAYFACGNMFAGVHQSSLFLRLSPADQAELTVAAPRAGAFEPMPGRPMREYMVVPAGVLTQPDVLKDWAHRSLAHAAALPAKAPKPKRS